jgi:hypothetical protein
MVALPSGVRRVKRGRREYWYFHQGRGTAVAKAAVRLPGDPTDPAFWQKLRSLAGLAENARGSFADLIGQYRQSPEWGRLRPATHRDYNAYLRGFERAWGTLAVRELTRAGVYAHRDGMATTPIAANHMLSVLRAFLEWCVQRGQVAQNVAHAIKRIETEDNGAKPWPEHGYRFVIDYAPEDIRRMAIIGRATGQRRSDLVRMRPVDRHEQGIRFKIGKLRDKSHWVPLTTVAATEIDSWSVEPMVPYLLSVTGKAYTGDGLNGRWYRWRTTAEAAPIAGLAMTIHGLRATAVVDRRLAGLTHQEIASQLGMSLKMVMRYSRFCDQEELAKAGMRRLEEHAAN